jgi:hypothetical protein
MMSELNLENSERIDGNSWIRLFWEPNKDAGNGFRFVCYEVVGMTPCDADPNCERDPWSGSYCDGDTEVLVHGEAYFDGVRHLYFGHEDTDNYGYHHYPHMKVLILIFQKLQELELKYCNPKEINPK